MNCDTIILFDSRLRYILTIVLLYFYAFSGVNNDYDWIRFGKFSRHTFYVKLFLDINSRHWYEISRNDAVRFDHYAVKIKTVFLSFCCIIKSHYASKSQQRIVLRRYAYIVVWFDIYKNLKSLRSTKFQMSPNYYCLPLLFFIMFIILMEHIITCCLTMYMSVIWIQIWKLIRLIITQYSWKIFKKIGTPYRKEIFNQKRIKFCNWHIWLWP